MRKTLLDVNFPVAAVSVNAAIEKSARQGHLSTLFFWFARRPTGLCRSALFASSVPADSDLPLDLRTELQERYPAAGGTDECLAELTADLSRWDAYRDNPLMDLANRVLKQSGCLALIDTFAGGGSIPLEAARLGFSTHASDLNPVAAVALRAALVTLPGASTNLPNIFEDVILTVGQKLVGDLGPLYDLPDLTNSDEETLPGFSADDQILAIFWSRTFRCQNCSWRIPLVRSPKLGREAFLTLVPAPEEKRFRAAVTSIGPGAATATSSGAKCPKCNIDTSFARLAALGREGQLGEQPMAILVRRGKSKKYLALKTSQISMLEAPFQSQYELPSIKLDVNGIRHLWAMTYGVTDTSDMFSSRQRHALGAFLERACEAIKDLSRTHSADVVEGVAILLAALVMRLVTYGSRHTWWQSTGEFPANAFGRQALPMVWDYVEIPPISIGAGGLSSASSWVRKAAHELAGTGLTAESVRCSDAATSGLQDSSIDLVAIDPPYYDTITYSYLSDCFYPFFKELLGRNLPEWFSTHRSPRGEEAIVDRGHSAAPSLKGDSHFRRKMGEAFQEASRILRPSGRLLIMYGHKQLSAWQALFSALAERNLIPISCISVTSERTVKFRHSKVAHLGTSCLISCVRPDLESSRVSLDWLRYQQALSDEALLRHALDGRAEIVAGDAMSRFGAGVALFMYSRVVDAHGQPICIDDAVAACWDASAQGS